MRAAGQRIVVGALLLLAPGRSRRVFGVPDHQDSGSIRLLARLFGVRNIVLGIWALMAQHQEPEQRRVCYQLNAVVYGVDVAALAIAGITGDGLVQAAAMGGALGSSEALAWVDLLGDLDRAENQGSVSLV
jgi:hypothetical protein